MLVFVEIELPLAICTRKGCHSSFSVCKNGRRLGKIHLHVDIWSSETDGDKDTEPHSPLESFPAEQPSDIKKKEKRETKNETREKNEQQISSSVLPPSLLQHQSFFLFSPSYKNKVPGRAFSSTDHFPQGCEGPRETGSSREHRKWVTEQRQEGRDSHGHAQVAKQEDFHKRHGIAVVMPRR